MKSKSFVSYLASFLVFLVFFAWIYVSIFEAQFGKPVQTEWWVKRSLDYKEYRAAQIDQKKIIIAGGSNALFGIESRLLEQFTQYPVVNMSVHAALDWEYVQRYLEPHVKAGDVVVIPVEYARYRRDYELSDWFARNIIAWGSKSYLEGLGTLDYLEFVARTPKLVLWEAMQASYKESKLMAKQEVIDEVLARNARAAGVRFNGYSHLSLNLYGDILAEYSPHKKVVKLAKKTGDDYRTPKAPLSPIFLENYRKLKGMIEGKGAQLVLTWPVSIRNKLFDMSLPEHQENIAYLTNQLKQEGIDVQCEPGLFNLDYRLFSNSMYHLNAKGARVRTIVLGDCLRSVLSGKPIKDQDDNVIVSKLKQLEGSILRMKYPLPK